MILWLGGSPHHERVAALGSLGNAILVSAYPNPTGDRVSPRRTAAGPGASPLTSFHFSVGAHVHTCSSVEKSPLLVSHSLAPVLSEKRVA